MAKYPLSRQRLHLARPAVDQPLALGRLAVLVKVVADQAHRIQPRRARVYLDGLVGRRLQAVHRAAERLARAHQEVVVALRGGLVAVALDQRDAADLVAGAFARIDRADREALGLPAL